MKNIKYIIGTKNGAYKSPAVQKYVTPWDETSLLGQYGGWVYTSEYCNTYNNQRVRDILVFSTRAGARERCSWQGKAWANVYQVEMSGNNITKWLKKNP